jgi:predicted transposase YbfD/YdcC
MLSCTIACPKKGDAIMNKEQKECYSEIDQLIDSQEFLESITKGFQRVEDPRVQDNKVYPLTTLLVVILCAILAGANTILSIHLYVVTKLPMFHRLLGLSKAPSYNVFWWLLTRLNPYHIEQCFVTWIQALPQEMRDKLISIDGKRFIGAERTQKIHMVSAWDSCRSLLLGQVKTREKSNEITAIPELLDSIDLQDATVTIDAAGCQTTIVEKIRSGGGNYVIALKGNQGTLRSEAENFFEQAREVGYEDAACQSISTCEKGHGRIEERQIVVTNQLDWLDCKEKWKDLTSLIEVTSNRIIKGKSVVAKRYYISNLELTPDRAGKIVRSHWSIENHLHWNMDVNFGEDSSLASIGHAAENLGVLKRLASTLIRIDLGGIRGTADRRRMAAWDDTWTLRLLARIFEVRL